MLRAVALVVAVAGCGRLGFDDLTAAGGGGRDGSIAVADAGLQLPPGDGAVPTSCLALPPFVYLIEPREEGSSGGSIVVTWCSSGLPGPLTIYLVQPDQMVRQTNVAAIADGFSGFGVPVQCLGCFFRLEANGYTYDGPPGDHLGD